MREFLEILKYVLPSVIVFVTAYYMLKNLMDNEQGKRRFELHKANQRVTTPVRLQAYERLTLFLERIMPNNLIVRLQKPGMTSKTLQREMLNAIRTEYNHNIAQQIYISHKAWTFINSAKENMVKLINTAAQRIQPDAPAMELSKLILQMLSQVEDQPVDVALEFLKGEVGQLFED